MTRNMRGLAAAAALLLPLLAWHPALAQKRGGILKTYDPDSPGSMSIMEEATVSRGGTCRQPYVKGLTMMVNSLFNGWRMEDVWLDK